MGLEFAERALNFPALEVQFGQFPRRSCVWIRDRGEESVGQGFGLRLDVALRLYSITRTAMPSVSLRRAFVPG